MANGWTTVKRVLSRPFKGRRRHRSAAAEPGTPNEDLRGKKILDQIAALNEQIDDLKLEILRSHAPEPKTVSPKIRRWLMRSRDLRYKIGLLRAESRRTSIPARAAAPRGLNNIPSPGCIPDCLSCLADRSPEVRRAAATILGRERFQPAAGALAILLRDEDCEVRLAAVEALGALRSEQSVYSLIRALEDREGRVRSAAQDALARTLPVPVELDVDEEPEVLVPKIEGLIRWWVDARVEGSLRECENE